MFTSMDAWLNPMSVCMIITNIAFVYTDFIIFQNTQYYLLRNVLAAKLSNTVYHLQSSEIIDYCYGTKHKLNT